MAVNSLFETDEFRPYAERFNARRRELARRKSYYDGSAYKGLAYRGLRQKFGWLWPRLYKGIHPLFLPMARATDVDAGIIPGGWRLPPANEEPKTKAWQEAINAVFDWSDWEIDGVLFVHYGAMYGVSNLKVADLREARRVVVKPVNPACLLLDDRAERYDSILRFAIWIEERTGLDGKSFEYAEVITPADVRTFANGTPKGFDEREPEYKNELGFVPFVEVDHIKTGEALGECTYQKAIILLDEVNELASYLADIIKKHAEPQWVVSGAEPSDLVKSGDNIWFVPAGATVTPLVAGVDIPGVLEFIREIRDQVHGSLPELAFSALLEKTQIATATLELQLMELVLKIKRTRPNYLFGLADALRMAGRAGASLNISEISLLDDEGLRFDGDAPILPIDEETRIRIETMALALEREKALGIKEGQGPGGNNA